MTIDTPAAGPERDVRSRRDLLAGAIFLAIALGFGLEALRYPLGTPFRMGPGFWPLTLAVILAAFGAGVLATGLRRHERIVPTPIPWRGLGLVTLAVVLFGELAPGLGLVPIVVLCTFLVALASVRNTVVSAATIAVALAALCWLVFKVGLGITLPTVGPLLSSGPLPSF